MNFVLTTLDIFKFISFIILLNNQLAYKMPILINYLHTYYYIYLESVIYYTFQIIQYLYYYNLLYSIYHVINVSYIIL